MPVLSRQSPPFQLGAWRVDPAIGELAQGTEVRRVRAQVMDLLLQLAARAGEVVSKDELIAGAWGGAAVADSALTSTIAELRELLGDQSRSPRYIETLPKRGYRLIAPITLLQEPGTAVAYSSEGFSPDVTAADASVASDISSISDTSATSGSTDTSDTSDTSDRSTWMRRSRRVAFALGAIFAVAAIVSIASITSNSRRQSAALSPNPLSSGASSTAAPSTAASMMRLTIDLPSDVRLAPDSTPRLALTVDGGRMAYVARTETGEALYTRTLDQFVAQPIAGTAGASAPFFSPDGSRVGFFANGELRTVPISGGAATIVCVARSALGASWGPDDTIVFSGTHGRGLSEAPAAGGPPRELTTIDLSRGELSHRWPQVLPDGDRVLFTSIGVTRVEAMIVSRRTGKTRVVVEQAQAATFVPPNRLLFERDGRLHVAAINPDRFELTGSGSGPGSGSGTSRVLVEDLASQGQGYGPPAFAAAGGGVLVYVPVDPHDGERDLVWVDRSGNAASLDAPPRSYMHPRLSRDGRQVLTWLRTRDADLWLFDIASRKLTRLVTGVSAHRAAWSPDGRQVMFDGPGPDNPVTLYLAAIDGGDGAAKPRQLRPDIKHSLYAGAWTPDGRTLAYADLTRTTGFDIIAMDATAAAPPTPPTPSTPSTASTAHASRVTPILRTPANETAPAFSPDGRWLAFVSDVTGREQVYLLPSAASATTTGPTAASTGAQTAASTTAPTVAATTRPTAAPPTGVPPLIPVQVSTQGGREPVWSRRGDELFFRQGESVLAVRVAAAAGRPRTSEPVTLFSGDFDQRPSFQPSYDVAADGRFLMIRGRAPSTTDARIAVLLRWDRP